MHELWITGAGVVTSAGVGMAALERALFDDDPVQPLLALDGDSFPYRPLPAKVEAAGQATAEGILDLCLGELLGGAAIPIEALRDGRTALVLGATAGAAPRWCPGAPRFLDEAVRVADLGEDAVADALAARWGLTGPRLVLCTACAASASAVGLAADMIAAGACERALVGSAEVLHWFDVQGFRAARLLARGPTRPFDAARDGLMLGEGGGLILLEAVSVPRAPLARLRGHASNNERHDVVQPEPSGDALHRCILEALDVAGVAAEQVGYVNAHGTGTVANDASEARAFARLWRRGPGQPWIGSTKGLHGHLRAASGIVELIVTLIALRRGLAPPTRGCREPDALCAWNCATDPASTVDTGFAVSVSRGFGGVNVALVLERGGERAP